MSSVHNGDSGRTIEASASKPDRRTIEASASKPDNRYGPLVLGLVSLVAAVVGAVFFKLNLNYFSHHKDLYALGVWGITSVGMTGLSNLYLFSGRNKEKGSEASSGASDPVPSDSPRGQPAYSKVPTSPSQPIVAVPRASTQGSTTTPQGQHPKYRARPTKAAAAAAAAASTSSEPATVVVLGIERSNEGLYRFSFTKDNFAKETIWVAGDCRLIDMGPSFAKLLKLSKGQYIIYHLVTNEGTTEIKSSDPLLREKPISELMGTHNSHGLQIGISVADAW